MGWNRGMENRKHGYFEEKPLLLIFSVNWHITVIWFFLQTYFLLIFHFNLIKKGKRKYPNGINFRDFANFCARIFCQFHHFAVLNSRAIQFFKSLFFAKFGDSKSCVCLNSSIYDPTRTLFIYLNNRKCLSFTEFVTASYKWRFITQWNPTQVLSMTILLMNLIGMKEDEGRNAFNYLMNTLFFV